MVRPTLLVGFIAILPTIGQAQGRMMVPAASHSVTAAPRMVAHAAQPVVQKAMPTIRIVARTGIPRTRATTATARNTRRPLGTRRRIDFDSRELRPGCSSVPGLGFDVSHLAAVCGPGAVGAGLRGNQFPLFFPSFGGGFFVPSVPVVVEEDGAAAETRQEEGTEAEVAETPRRVRVIRPAPAPVKEVESAVETGSAVPRHQDEFVFVRRDGTLFFAVAYAWENGTLRYITNEGLRRSLGRDALDLDATQQFNEQRGLNFHLPA